MALTPIGFGADLPPITPELFTFRLGDDAALLPRTVAIIEPYQALVVSNHERLARWFPGLDRPPTLDETRRDLERRDRAQAGGSQVPVAIAVKGEDAWQLVGEVNLLVDRRARSGEVGYWLDGGSEGRGLATRAVTAMLDHAFGPLGLDRVELRTNPTNTRSRNVAQRLGFTQEGILREAAAFGEERRDEVVYGLLAREWHGA